MGQAKRRGTFEQRKATAIKHNAERIRKCKLAGITKKQIMTTEKKERKRRATKLFTILSALEMGTTVIPYKI
jgi:hypothetical protein